MPRLILRGLLFTFLALPAATLAASVTLTADSTSPDPADPTPAYTVIRKVLGPSGFNTPDCTHPDFGPHITQEIDADLGRIFLFHSHVTPDGDMCVSTNHPRNEIKVDAQSDNYLKAFNGDRVSYRWRFRLPPGFQSSYNFTYVHQIKAANGDTLLPLIAFNLQKGRNGAPDTFGVNHADSAGIRTTLSRIDLTPFLGEWVEAYERVTADTHGHYALTLRRERDHALLLDYNNDDIDMWRFSGTTFIRPKWGLYRSVDNPQFLRDEAVAFKSFCLAKGDDECTAVGQVDAPVFSPAPGQYDSATTVTLASASAGASIRYTSDGSTPDCGNGTLYSAPLQLTRSTTLQAVACQSGLADSPVASGSYVIYSAPVKVPLAPPAASASSSADSNHRPAASLDANYSSYWAANGDGQWLSYDLGTVRTLSHARIAWFKGTQARVSFELQTSLDGVTFTPVLSGQSSGTTAAFETYDFPDVSARYLRIVGHGNSVNGWNLVAETEIYALP